MTKYFIEDFLEIFKSLFVFGKELNSGKTLIFSFSEVIKLILKVFLVFAIPLLVVSIITQFLVGGINFSLQAIYWKFEKINPSLEPSHAFAEAIKIAPKLNKDTIIIVNSCGDAKKDRDILKERLGKN